MGLFKDWTKGDWIYLYLGAALIGIILGLFQVPVSVGADLAVAIIWVLHCFARVQHGPKIKNEQKETHC